MSNEARKLTVSAKHRRHEIARLLLVEPVSVDTLAERFQVSLSTIRRDLDKLSQSGVLHRTYGGAVPSSGAGESSLRERSRVAHREKASIGAYAASLIEPGTLNLLDAGSTVGALARALAGRRGFTVMTNAIESAQILSSTEELEVVLLGGNLRAISGSTLGPFAEQAIRSVTADAAFVSGDGVDPVMGVSERSQLQSALKRAMVEAAASVFVLADASKLGAQEGRWWTRLPQPWTLITDVSAPPEIIERFKNEGVEVCVAPALRNTSPPLEEG